MSKKQVISVIGASGFIGNSLFNYLRSNLKDNYDIIGTCFSNLSFSSLHKLDITNYINVEDYLVKFKPDYIFLAAGTKDVQLCEKSYDYAYAINTTPVETFIQVIEKHQLYTKSIFFSTDYVFGGQRGDYKDTDIPDPKTNYGKSKYLAENALLNSDIDFKIIRTAAVMGIGSKFLNWLIHELKTNEEVILFDDVFFTPTPITFLNECSTNILLNYGIIDEKILHVTGGKRLSRYKFASLITNYIKSNALVIPERYSDSHFLLQHNLSLIPSDIIKKWTIMNFEDYIKRELLND